MRRVLTVSLLLAACLAVGLAAGTAAADGGDTAVPSVVSPDACEANATTEAVGCWNGIHHADDPADLGIDQSDGLSEAELENMTYLKMARVEAIRDRPFNESVPVETITREEFAERGVGGESDPEFNRWNDQVWKALFVIGEDESSEAVIDEVFSGAVAGFYAPADDRITIVVEEGETLHVSPTTLLHELGHAMQDQYENLTDPRYSGATQDADLGVDGIVEGEVVYMEEVYAERCEAEWTCMDEPPPGTDGGAADDSDPNRGVWLTVLQPYSDGAPYVDTVLDEEGWEGVDRLMADPPTTTRETIHREPFEPEPIEFTDTAENGWKTYDEQGVNGSDTVGEASLFVSMWFQSGTYGAGADVIDHNEIFDTDHPYRTYNYAHPVTDGWVNDELYPYRNDEGDRERDGYVWVIEWDDPGEAERFHDAYRRVLGAHDAHHRSDGVHYVATGGFRGAYGVERDGTRVTIAHALDPEAVFDLRPGIDLEEPASPNGSPPEAPDDVPGGGTDGVVTPVDPNGADDTSSGAAPGFGVAVAATALLVASLLARRDRR